MAKWQHFCEIVVFLQYAFLWVVPYAKPLSVHAHQPIVNFLPVFSTSEKFLKNFAHTFNLHYNWLQAQISRFECIQNPELTMM